MWSILKHLIGYVLANQNLMSTLLWHQKVILFFMMAFPRSSQQTHTGSPTIVLLQNDGCSFSLMIGTCPCLSDPVPNNSVMASDVLAPSPAPPPDTASVGSPCSPSMTSLDCTGRRRGWRALGGRGGGGGGEGQSSYIVSCLPSQLPWHSYCV